ncbi:hypothetical protein ABTZ58_32455 [Streptomyces sp. NPDC094143]
MSEAKQYATEGVVTLPEVGVVMTIVGGVLSANGLRTPRGLT